MSDEKALAIVPKTFVEIQTMAEAFSKSALLPEALRGKVPDLVFQIMAGAELGLAPVASIRGIHIIQGRPTLAADTMMGLVLCSGLCEYFVQTDASATSVTFETKRKGSPVPQRCTWTLDDAKRASLHQKDTWRSHPRQMLASRAKAELARSAYPDVLAGCFDPDELPVPVRPSAVMESRTPDVVDAEFVDAPDPLTAIDTAGSLEELDALIPSLRSLTGDAAKERNRRYRERKAKLQEAMTRAPSNESSATPAERREWEDSLQPEQVARRNSRPAPEPEAA